MTKRQRLISAALCDRLPIITRPAYQRWYEVCTQMVADSEGPHRTLRREAVAVAYIYHMLGIIPLPLKRKGWPERYRLGDALTESDMNSLLNNLGVPT